jgi:hypothetical protein
MRTYIVFIRVLFSSQFVHSVRIFMRTYIAWLEEDSEVAATLLQESCAGGNVNFLRDATELSIVTNSDDLADYYFRRWSDAAGMKEVAQWFKWDSLHPEVQEWKQRHAPNPPAKKAR